MCRVHGERQQPEIPEGTVVTQEGFLQSNAFVIGIIIAEVVVVIIGLVIFGAVFRGKKK